MSDPGLRLYHWLPAPMRPVIATLAGIRLRWWRYGPETEQLVEEALERERWSPDRWRTWQEERLAFVLWRAVRRVPYYRDLWAARRRKGDRASWEVLENWPILEKETVRRMPLAFVADDCRVSWMFHEQTGGTSGTPLHLWWSRRTVRAWYALFEARCRRWYGVSRRDRWGILGGRLVTPVNQRKPPFWVWNAGLNQLYLSSYHLAPDLRPSLVEAMRRHRIRFLYGYPSSLHALTAGLAPDELGELGLAVVVTNAEPLLDHQRAAIAQAFRCPVRQTYGMSEIVAAATECEAGRLHLWADVGVNELMDQGEAVAPGESGELICTGLLNADMPLIRYRVGDRGRVPAGAEACSCGRTLPLLAGIDGRTGDVLITRDGRAVWWLNPVFYGLPIREGQIVQESLDVVRIRYVPAAGFTGQAARTLTDRLQARMGEVSVVLEPVERVPRTASGKLKPVVCRLDPNEIRALLAPRVRTPTG